MKEKIKSVNSSWSFKLDNVHLYSYWHGAFTKEECKKIIQIAKKNGMIKGTTMNNNKLNVRESKISWLYPSDDMNWVFRRVTDMVLDLNQRFFNFDIFGLSEGFQFTNYKAPSNKYGKHVDRASDFIVRKLSISIQLTDPKEYEGGELYLYEDDKGILMDKKQGTLIMFPSYMLHEVKPVTKGERNSLVTWVTGNQFK
jgi:PKHD-type hydroxylase|tara:strand:- start:1316 stop:1909 length:594 start_codon:yes stop_codon:yes gene_type:complete